MTKSREIKFYKDAEKMTFWLKVTAEENGTHSADIDGRISQILKLISAASSTITIARFLGELLKVVMGD